MKYLKKFNESESTEMSREIKRLQDEALTKSSNVALSGTRWVDVVKEYLEENNIDPKTTKTEQLLNILKELNVPNNILYTTIEEVRNS
jgi:hypothetical protein